MPQMAPFVVTVYRLASPASIHHSQFTVHNSPFTITALDL